MTAAEFKRELYEASKDYGFKRGSRVMVNGRTGTVQTKIIRNSGILQSVKFDDGTYGSFADTDLMAVVEDNDRPNEVDLLGQRIRQT